MDNFNPGYVVNSLAYAAIGLALFGAAFAILLRVLPFNLWREVQQERNVAAAVIAGALALGLAVIIASSVH